MKKRILGLALALVMIISLLPLTAMAASPLPKFRMYDPSAPVHSNGNYIESFFSATKTVYVVYENIIDTDGTTVLGNKPVIATEVPTDNYIKYEFAAATDTTKATATITLKNINYKRVSIDGVNNNAFISITKNAGTSYTSEFDVVMVFEGTNTVEGSTTRIAFEHTGDATITGSGSFAMTTYTSSTVILQKKNEGNLTIKNTTLTIDNTYTGTGGTAAIVADGNIVIEGSTVNVSGTKQHAITVGTAYTTESTDTTKGVTIKGGSNVTLIGGSQIVLNCNGPINIENSTVEIRKGASNDTSFATSVPTVTGSHSSIQAMRNAGNSPSYKDWVNEQAAGTVLTVKDDNDKLIYDYIGFKTVHECTAAADDGDCTTPTSCACGKAMGEAKQHAGVVTDCTKDTMCTNAGCTQVYAAKLGDTHTAGADDGDCTTGIKCVNCDQIAVKGAEKHAWDSTDCSVARTCTTNGCTKTAEAGAHTGGTATCKAKAKCESCGAEYGELGACAPAADDGDCTTDIKCSVCGKTTTAGEAAHKYTDKADTTCDNAGCTKTRVVEGEENPKTGDNTALVLVAALMVTAAAAFVTTKKFAR